MKTTIVVQTEDTSFPPDVEYKEVKLYSSDETMAIVELTVGGETSLVSINELHKAVSSLKNQIDNSKAAEN